MFQFILLLPSIMLGQNELKCYLVLPVVHGAGPGSSSPSSSGSARNAMLRLTELPSQKVELNSSSLSSPSTITVTFSPRGMSGMTCVPSQESSTMSTRWDVHMTKQGSPSSISGRTVRLHRFLTSTVPLSGNTLVTLA